MAVVRDWRYGPAIKLTAMQGEGVGMMFLGSFVVFEGIVFLKKNDARWRYELVVQEVRVLECVIQYLKYTNRLEPITFSFTILTHCGILV